MPYHLRVGRNYRDRAGREVELVWYNSTRPATIAFRPAGEDGGLIEMLAHKFRLKYKMVTMDEAEKAKNQTFKLYTEDIARLEDLAAMTGGNKTAALRHAIKLAHSQL
jgi:hypothetical protein